jgi:hypothetical protein
LISSGNEAIGQNDQTQLYSNEGHFTNLISSLLCEENNGEEEERESKDHKSTLSFCEFDLSNVLAELTIAETRQTSWVEPHETTATQPPLFTLFHTYLI